MPDFTSVGSPQGAGYGAGLVDFSALSGDISQQSKQKQQRQQLVDPRYAFGRAIGQWMDAYRRRMQQYGLPQEQQQQQPGPPMNILPPGVGGNAGPNSPNTTMSGIY